MFICTFIISSCTRTVDVVSEENNVVVDHTIPIETALNSLDELLNEIGVVTTKGATNDYVENFFAVCGSSKGTRVSATTGNVIYAVNFKDEKGYALLAADDRIQEDVLAVVDEGSVSEEDFVLHTGNLAPTNNDDLSESEYYEMVNSGVLAAGSTKQQINMQCVNYAEGMLDDRWDNGHDIFSSDNSTYEWKIIKQVPRMVNTLWTQSTSEHDIFDKYCPEVGLIFKKKAPAGCVCIAVSQIVAYHEYPSLCCNGVNIDYPSIKQVFRYNNRFYTGSDATKEMLARFTINIGALCDIKYHSIFGYNFGFAWPSDAEQCLRSLGYRNVRLDYVYDENLVLNSLDKGCPVFMSAISGIISGHAWVVDGYIKREYGSGAGFVADYQTLVHCNWGWHGDCNGYFTSGIFHTQEAVISDNISENHDNDYWIGFNTITYDNPNQ